ncbi:MAG: hypothetical protein JWO59_2202 [Chloroflexi bacterium]|nr:hypothetical protein [Chloroflexota bacterium]
MNPTIEGLYQDNGREALATADDLAGKLLVYAEVDDGVISADMVYAGTAGNTLRFKFCPVSLMGTIETLWSRWREHPDNYEWRAMCYVIESGKFKAQFSYPDEIDPVQDVGDRRSLAVKKHFGEADVDCSAP